MTQERQLRLELFDILRKMSEAERQAYIRMPEIAEAMKEYSVPLLPARDAIVPTKIVSKFLNLKCDESFTSILVDIVMEALGLQELVGAMKQARCTAGAITFCSFSSFAYE